MPSSPYCSALFSGRLTHDEAAGDRFGVEAPGSGAWDDLLGFLLDQARANAQPAAQPVPNVPKRRRAPALTPAIRAALTHEAIIARHRWPAASRILMDARHTFEAEVATDGRSIIVHCSAITAATLHPHAMENQP